MFGIEKDFQNLMEQVYGPLNKDKMTKKTNEPSGWNPVFEFPLDEPNTIIIDGVKYKRVEEPEELKTLYQMLNDEEEFRDDICSVVKEWMSQYTHNVMTGEYLKGYEECLTVLEENLK